MERIEKWPAQNIPASLNKDYPALSLDISDCHVSED
jgi:hypothetical protein